MKRYLLSLFNGTNRRKTLLLGCISTILISSALIMGKFDSYHERLLLFSGIVMSFFTLLHPWGNPANYARLVLISIVVLIIQYIFFIILVRMKLISTDLDEIPIAIALIFCIPGIFTGVTGILISSINGKKK
ncbi:MAG TPA: hypothetical protein VK213_05655 [Bacteroidales bacterium]|nr:hypothetical protein [Bacteroidales bacterium]